MANTLPGVEVEQIARTQTSTASDPALRPLILGVCREVVPLRDSDGAPNPDALLAATPYQQVSIALPQASFPSPRDNISEVNVEEDRVSVALLYGGQMRDLVRGSHGLLGEAFLCAQNGSRRAAVRSTVSGSFAFDSVVGDPLTFALDVVNSANTSRDITVTLRGTLTVAETVDLLNAAAGDTVAREVTYESDTYLEIASTVFGAGSSVTIRAGTSSLKKLFGSGFDDSTEIRVVGSGFRGQDDEDNDLLTPWVEWFRGGYYVDGTAQEAWPASATEDEAWPVLLDADDTAYEAVTAAMTFAGINPTVPLRAGSATYAGDRFYADGVIPGDASAEVIRVEAGRFRLGVLDSTSSTYDSAGVPTNRVYTRVEVNTLNHPTAPLAPERATFQARGLRWDNISPAPAAAVLVGEGAGRAPRAGMVMSSSNITFPLNLASLTLDYRVDIGGVEGEQQTLVFAGGPYANIAALIAALGDLTDAGLVVSNAGNRLLLATQALGAGETVAVLSTGTANTALRFSTSAATTDTGKDVEFCDRATVTGLPISLPTYYDVDLTVVVEDSKGTHTLSGTVALSAATDADSLAEVIAVAFGGSADDLTLYDGPGGEGAGGIPVATVSVSETAGSTLTIALTSLEGGASVTLAVLATNHVDGGRALGFEDADGGRAAIVTGDVAVGDTIALRGTVTFTGTSGFKVTTVGLGNNLADTNIFPTAGDYTVDEAADAIAEAIDAASVLAGNSAGLVSAGYSRVDDAFTITITGATQITIGAPSTGTDMRTTLFGTHTAAQSAAAWEGGALGLSWGTIDIRITVDGDDLEVSGSLGLDAIQDGVTAAQLAALLNAAELLVASESDGPPLLRWCTNGASKLLLRTLDGTGTRLRAGVDRTGLIALGFTSDFDTTASGSADADAAGEDGLLGTTLRFYLDGSPHVYDVAFSTNSAEDAAYEINEAVAGAGVVGAVTEDRNISLTSLLAGAASSVRCVSGEGYSAGALLGLVGSAYGSGRPMPDLYLDDEGVVYIGASILRDPVSGDPYDLGNGGGGVYVGYRGVRRDVTARGQNRAVLALDSLQAAEAALGPFTTENPLGLAVSLAIGAAVGKTVYAYGIDEADAASPTGTYDAWIRALEGIEGTEVYAIAALTGNPLFLPAIKSHVEVLSAANGRMERVSLVWTEPPTRELPLTVMSGVSGGTTGTDNVFALESNPGSALLAAGVNPASAIPYSAALYLEMRVASAGATSLRRYNVSRVVGQVLTLRTTFTSSQNLDGFYDTTALSGTEELVGQDWSLRIRGDELVITGTTLPDANAIAAAGAAEAASLLSKRMFYLYCSAVEVEVEGVMTRVPGYYAAAALAGQIAALTRISGPLTGQTIPGIGTVYGTDDGTLTVSQLSVLKDGGRWILARSGNGTRTLQSVTTKPSPVAEAESSVVMALDSFSKGARELLSDRVGNGQVITEGYRGDVAMALQGYSAAQVARGTIASASPPEVSVDPTDSRSTLASIEVGVLNPANKIRLQVHF